MRAFELRTLARESLQNKWGKAALLTLVYTLVTIALSFALAMIPLVGSIASIIITPVLTFGFLVTMIRLSRNEDVSFFEFFDNGFSKFGKVWGVALHTLLRMILPILIIVIGAVLSTMGFLATAITSSSVSEAFSLLGFIVYLVGILWTLVKSFSFVLTSYILYDEPQLSSSEIVKKSALLMRGNKWRFFCLGLSFIGWSFLVGFTFGIGSLWLTPYTQIASLKFYEELASSSFSRSGEFDALD